MIVQKSKIRYSIFLAFNMTFSFVTFAQQLKPINSKTETILQAKTPIFTIADYTNNQFIDFALSYANAKVVQLKQTDSVAAQEWYDYFLIRADSISVPAGVLAFSKKLQALGKAAQTDSRIDLSKITGEKVMEVVFSDYQQHIQQISKQAP